MQLGAVDLYRVLELTHTATPADIRSAYRRLAKKYHPDVSALPDAHARFIAITEAHEVLSDPLARGRYDRTLLSPSPRTASASAQARYTRSTQERQRSARTKAEAYGRMRYQQFDEYAFDTVAGYVAPKMLGCLGLAFTGFLLMLMLVWLHGAIGLPVPIVVLGFFCLIPAGAYASTRFDAMHNNWQIRRKRKQR